MNEDMRNTCEHCEAVPDVASATECTGLIPALTDAAGESARRALYAIPRAKRERRLRKKQ